MPDFIPSADDALDPYATNLITRLTSAPADYGETVPTLVELTTATGAWNTAYPANVAAQTAAAGATAAKDTARENLETAIRNLNNRVQARPAVTNAAKELAGLPVHATGGGTIPAPDTAPLLRIDTSHRFRHTVDFRDAANPSRRGKPEGVYGVKLYLKIGGPPPTGPGECQFIALDTATPYMYEFAPADAGKTAWWIACWVNPRQEDGPCSETVGGTIPG